MNGAKARLRQAVLAASELEPVADRLQAELGLDEPFSDPAVAAFGLRNAVFALGDTFIEVVSPVEDGTAAGRWLERRGADGGYMLMFQVDDLEAARERVRELAIREVFALELDDIAEVHLHPRDMRGAIVALGRPAPPSAWRWGGPGWEQRSVAGGLSGATISVREPPDAAERWGATLDTAVDEIGIRFVADDREAGLVELSLARNAIHGSREVGGVRFAFD